MSKPPAKLETPLPPKTQSDDKTHVWAPGETPPAEWIERQRKRSDFAGYLLVGGPLDGDFVRFENKIGQKPVIHLDRPPRPGWPNSSSIGDAPSIDDYLLEFLTSSGDGLRRVSMRFYRHKSIDVGQALNRLLLWYLPPETRPSLDANAVRDIAAELELAEIPSPDAKAAEDHLESLLANHDTCEHEFEDCLREREFGALRTIEKRCRKCHQWAEL